MNSIWIVFQLLIGYNLVLPIILYLLTFFVNRKCKADYTNKTFSDYAIVVTAYEQTHMLKSVIDSILKLNYDHYHVYVVADNCDVSTLNVSHSSVSIFRPEMVLASNTKSHFYAIERFVRDHDILTIIDSDNLVHPEYINELNVLFNRGFNAVQGVREAKNLNTTIACLDAARDLYYSFYDGKILFALGSSSTLAGSGMAFKTKLYIECLRDTTITGAGFDKVLQAQLLIKSYRVAYAPKAIVYDEKTTLSGQLVSQRSRWINTWFKYIGFSRDIILKGIINRSVNQLLFGIVLARPPLFLFILSSVVCLIINLFINPLHAIYWGIGLSLFIIGFFIALIKQNSTKKIYRSFGAIPKFIFLQVVSLYYSRTANKRSIATKH